MARLLLDNGAYMARLGACGRVFLGLGHTPGEARLRAVEAFSERTGYPMVGIVRERIPVECTHKVGHRP